MVSADAVAIGNYIVELYKNWHPSDHSKSELLIGQLYGFDLYIRRKLQTVETTFSSRIEHVTSLYAESKQTGIKYMQNGGAPNIDNPKLAARYFLSSIDRVVGMAERYEKELGDLNRQIPEIFDLTQRQFEQEYELAALKQELNKLDLEISRNIAEKEKEQVAQHLFEAKQVNEEVNEQIMEPVANHLKR